MTDIAGNSLLKKTVPCCCQNSEELRKRRKKIKGVNLKNHEAPSKHSVLVVVQVIIVCVGVPLDVAVPVLVVMLPCAAHGCPFLATQDVLEMNVRMTVAKMMNVSHCQ